MSEEKGINTLIEAVKDTGITVKVVGTGPLTDDINNKLLSERISNVELLGFKSGNELTDIVANARAVVIPSEWYENGPYSAIEALQLSRPLIGANIGGIPELVNGNGYLFESKDISDLREKIIKLDTIAEADYLNMKHASLKMFNNEYTDKVHYDKLMDIYQKALG